jgi:hypothetical protein
MPELRIDPDGHRCGLVMSVLQPGSSRRLGSTMNAIGYPQQYPGMPGQAFNTQILKRPLTDAERDLPGRYYKLVQKSLRGISLFCLIMFVLSTYVLPVMITDAITYDTISTVLFVFMIVFGLVAIGFSVNAIVVRKKITQTMMEGTAVEVLAPAFKAGAGPKGAMWTVGPISIVPNRTLQGLIAEGQPTSVLCIPRLKAAIAINNFGLKQGMRIICPPNLEAMAVPVGPMPNNGPIPSSAYPTYSGPSMQSSQSAQDDDLPPPPPDWESK